LSTQDYYTAWTIYLLCSAGLAAVFWKMTDSQNWRSTALILRLTLLTLLLVPYYSNPGSSTMAPAILVVLFESLFNDPELAMKAARPILITLTLVIAGTLIYSLVNRNRAANPAVQSSPKVTE